MMSSVSDEYMTTRYPVCLCTYLHTHTTYTMHTHTLHTYTTYHTTTDGEKCTSNNYNNYIIIHT